MGNIVGAIVLGVIAIICFVFSYLQFNEKGFLFNNAYIYASKQERKNMDKKPYYKQSGIVFLLIGIIFLINIIDIILHHFTTYANRYIDAKAAVSVPL